MPVNLSGNPHLRPSGSGSDRGETKGPSKKVLVAEDEPVTHRTLEATLRKWGYGVLACSDGTEAWRKLQREDAPGLVVLDWMMPGMSGVEICRRLRSPAHSQPTYIILLTAKGRRRDIVTGLQAGADDYVTKPFNADELRARLGVGDRVIELQSAMVEWTKDLEGTLSRVQQTVGDLREKETELRQLNDSLEEQVKERTRHLSMRVEQLESEIERVRTGTWADQD